MSKIRVFIVSPPWGDFEHVEFNEATQKEDKVVEDAAMDTAGRYAGRILRMLLTMPELDVHWLKARKYSQHVKSYASGAIVERHPMDPYNNPDKQFSSMLDNCEEYFKEFFNVETDVFLSIYRQQGNWAVQHGVRRILEINCPGTPVFIEEKFEADVQKRVFRTIVSDVVYGSVCALNIAQRTMIPISGTQLSILASARSSIVSYPFAIEGSDIIDAQTESPLVPIKGSNEIVLYFDGPRHVPQGIEIAIATFVSISEAYEGKKTVKLWVSGLGVMSMKNDEGVEIGPIKRILDYNKESKYMQNIVDLGLLSFKDVVRCAAKCDCMLIPDMFPPQTPERILAALITSAPVATFPVGVWVEIHALLQSPYYPHGICRTDHSYDSYVDLVKEHLEHDRFLQESNVEVPKRYWESNFTLATQTTTTALKPMYLALIQKVASREENDIAPYTAHRVLNMLTESPDPVPKPKEENEENEQHAIEL